MPPPSLSNDRGFPRAASALTSVKSSGPSVPGSLGALEALLFNHNSVLRAEPAGDQTRFHTHSLSPCPPASPLPLPRSPWQGVRCVSPQHPAYGDGGIAHLLQGLGKPGPAPHPSAEQGNPRFTILLAAHQRQGKFKACAAAGSRVSPHPGWHQGDLLPNMRITHESQFLQKSGVSLYASGPPWIPALW